VWIVPSTYQWLVRCDLIWDPARAQAAGALDYIQESIRFNKREASLAALHEHNYQIATAQSALDKIKVKDGSDWTDEQKELFHSEMFRLRKNLVDVARATGVCNNVGYTYYLAKFKKSNDYRLLKSICEEERMDKFAASDQGLDACGICGDGGSLLICDGCEGEYHMTCLRPPLVEVPEGAWFCDTCIDSNFLEARDKVIHQFYVEIGDGHKKRKANEMEADESTPLTRKTKSNSSDIVLRSSDTVLNAVKALASCIAQALTPS
jgi:PHD-finger